MQGKDHLLLSADIALPKTDLDARITLAIFAEWHTTGSWSSCCPPGPPGLFSAKLLSNCLGRQSMLANGVILNPSVDP